MTNQRVKKQHLVSASYQRLWSDDDGYVAVIRKQDRSWLHGHPKTLLRRTNFLTFTDQGGQPSDELEGHFGRIEAGAIPFVRRLVAGDRDNHVRRAALNLLVLHWARSTSIAHVLARTADTVMKELSIEPETIAAFRQDNGRSPRPNEIEGLVERVFRGQQQNLFVDQIAPAYNNGLDKLGGHHVQIVTIRGSAVTFVAADSPVVLSDKHRSFKGTAVHALALGDASEIWFPLGPHVGISLAVDEVDDIALTPADAQAINKRCWQYAEDLLIGSPKADLDRALALSGDRRLRFQETRRRT